MADGGRENGRDESGRTFFVDSPATEDQLDFKSYAEVLADVICDNATQTPLTLGIFGSWGTGKTTLMGLIENALHERMKSFVPIRFDAWKYDKEDALSRAMLLRVLDALRPPSNDQSDQAKKLQETLDRLAENLYKDIEWKDKGGLTIDWPKLVKWGSSGALKLSFAFVPGGSLVREAVRAARGADKDKIASGLETLASAFKREVVEHHQAQLRFIDQFQTEFAKLVKEHFGTRRLIVFVDDLDRCLPEKALDVLEAVKLFLDVEGCVFVLALDSQIVARGIRVKYRELANELAIDASLYLGKIIQLPFLLPPIDVDDMRGYIKSLNASWPDPGCIEVFAGGLEPNPRQVKRAVNVFLLLWKLAEKRRQRVGPKITPLRLAKIVCLQTAHLKVFEWIKKDARRLRQLESYCISGNQAQASTGAAGEVDSEVRQMSEEGQVKNLFQLPQGDKSGLGGFQDLELEDLRAFFSLTRSVLQEKPQSKADETVSAVPSGLSVTENDIVGRDIVTQFAVNVPPAVSALHQLPAPPADFTGRAEELKELAEAVKTGGTILSLQGLGGSGKTALALKLAEQLKSDYLDAQFYLDLKGASAQPMTPRDAMAHVVRAWHPTAQLPEKEEEIAPIYRSTLDGKRALLLLDNARDARQVAPLVPPAGCLLLVTSRKHFTLPGLVEKNLDKLPPADARALLLRIAPRLKKETTEQVDEVAQLSGYVPLALRAVGSALHARKNLSLADYVHQMTDARERLKLTQIDAAFQPGYDLLEETLRQQFRFLAVFPDSFDLAAAAAVWDIPPEKAQDPLGELLAYSLIDFDQANARYILHNLVRLFANLRLREDERTTASKRHCKHYLAVLQTANDFYTRGGEAVVKGLELFDLEWPNIQAGQTWASAHADEDDIAADYCCRYPFDGAYCLNLRQHPRERIRWLEPALAAAQRLKQRNWESHALRNLGIAYLSLGEYRRAIEYLEQSLQITHEIGDRLGEGNALGNLGIAYSDMGEYRRAIEYHEQYLKIAREIGDRLGEGNALGNLGIAYSGSREYRRAVDYDEQRLKIAREIGDRRGEGQALGNLGLTYDSLGEPRRAVDYQEQSLEIFREIGDRLGEANALFNSALALDQLGDRGAAIARAEAALKIYEAIESPHAPKVRDELAKWRGEDQARGQGGTE
jgi:tetratricopeptide (TPR) repeat protein